MGQVIGYSLLWGLFGIVLTVALWPTVRSGQRFLRRWGVQDPGERQGAQAARFLRNQHLMYLPVFLLAPVVSYYDSAIVQYVVAFVVMLLLTEIVVAIRPARGPRTATLVRRHWHDLVPRWTMAVLVAIAALTAVLAVLGLLAQPWADQVAAMVPPNGGPWSVHGYTVNVSAWYRDEIGHPTGWLALTGVLVDLVTVLGVVRLAVRRGPVADLEVDAVLRTRGARCAVGFGLLWLSSLTLVATNRLSTLRHITIPETPAAPEWLSHTAAADYIGLPVVLLAIVAFIWVANPSRPMPFVRASA
jgi:hypothetical protein